MSTAGEHPAPQWLTIEAAAGTITTAFRHDDAERSRPRPLSHAGKKSLALKRPSWSSTMLYLDTWGDDMPEIRNWE